MKKVWIAFGMLLLTAPAHADITSKITSSIQLTVDAAASQATRLGSSYSVSGSNVTINTEGGLGTLTAGSAVGYTPADYSAPTDGTSFSFTEAFTEGDATPSNTTITSGVAPSLPAFGSVTTTAGGVAGDLAGSIDSSSAVSLTAGGAGTSATGQFVTEILVK
jgi:hypothetical protein